jgi:hypothetical protein
VLDDALRASEADIAKLQGKLREARTRQNAIQSRLESANQRARLREMYAGPKVDEAFSRFDVLERAPTSPRAAPTRWRSALRPRRSTRRSPSFATPRRSTPSSRR